ncbi:response regulator transcription factor [Elizabethkingia meningoseptica]|uniref:response regulator transcription factor n=1 Tax=Elizabethkingia meningoseptica TaxID=238 RepID=UPI0023B0D29E|nr:response regulator transcription factor [Elizabethkingia meningoseptica]MDE5467865.1 response regulator transcription factor [Elizabethkingia meningoseptica]MDE5474784.1 response regulator transcription factor [Elizabethkingia meningoseptica]MDE5478217.1 response regulator transcription factor [Elizabethkingia meningoseptica]MDE5486616.1 response regulator transcription factor [Elizabethkingia meningoseptica]MDE5501792.1 response regulator transcription factor [Elizabethkingia meningoseptic
MAHILLIEDDDRLSKLIAKGLQEAEFDISIAYDGASGLKLATQKDFDLVVTDIVLPKKDGLDFCKEIKNLKPNLPVVMLTALGTTDDKLEGFDAGADDYLTKPFEMRELVARIRVLLKRFSLQKQQQVFVLKYEGIEMNLEQKTVSRNRTPVKLTPKEFNLLKFMLENTERVLSRSEIAEKVWETHFDTGTNFIDVYINYLRKKIDKDFETKLIHTKAGMGFILKKDYESDLI